jgi:hypothetical protein
MPASRETAVSFYNRFLVGILRARAGGYVADERVYVVEWNALCHRRSATSRYRDRVFRESFDHRRDPTYNENAISLTPTYRVNYSDDWYFSFYRDFYFAHDAEPKARERLLGVTDGQRVFFSRSIDYTNITDFFTDVDSSVFEYTIQEFNGDRLELKVDAPEDGYVSYIDNWDPDWKAYVNGEEVRWKNFFLHLNLLG